MLEVLHQTETFVAIDKPAGLLVHPSSRAGGERESCMGLLRDQLGRWVYPVHRLDRPTSGVLLFAFDSESAERLSRLYREKRITKTYLAVARGFVPESGVIDRPLRKDFEDKSSPYLEASTSYRCVDRVELPFAVGRYSTSRYSLVEVTIQTGRLHQIRRHLASIAHHVIGDTVHGDGRHNRFFREQYGINRLLLHASKVEFYDESTQRVTCIQSNSLIEFLDRLRPIFPTLSTVAKKPQL